MFRKPFADFNPKAFGTHRKIRLWLYFRSKSLGCVVPLRPFDQRKLRETVVDELSVPLDVVELLVPEGLFSVKFESHSHIPGVSPPFDPTGHVC